MSESDDGFVSRWSRLKRHQTPPAEAAPPAPDAVEPEAPQAAEGEAGRAPDSDEIVKNLPDIETLTKESDFTPFLQDGVPEELRNRALRHLWRLSPVFANVDGLNDYDLDYTDAAVAVKGVLKTLYQVGRGMPDPVKPEDEAEEVVAGTAESHQAGETDARDAPDDGNVNDGAEEAQGADQPAALTDAAAEPLPREMARDGEERRPTVAMAPQRGTAARRRWERFSS